MILWRFVSLLVFCNRTSCKLPANDRAQISYKSRWAFVSSISLINYSRLTHFGAQAYAMFDADGSGSMTRMEIVEVQYDYMSSLSSGWDDGLGHIRGPGKDLKDRSRVGWIWDRGRTEVNVSASYAIVFLFLATQPFHSELPLKLVFYSSAFLLTTSFPQPELFELCFWIFAVTFPNWYLAHPIWDQVQALHTHT